MAAPLPYPALVASHAGNWIALANGETLSVGRGEAIARAADTPVILLNAPLTAARLGYGELSGLDVLEIGRAHVCTPVTNAHLVCRLLLEKKKQTMYSLNNITT